MVEVEVTGSRSSSEINITKHLVLFINSYALRPSSQPPNNCVSANTSRLASSSHAHQPSPDLTGIKDSMKAVQDALRRVNIRVPCATIRDIRSTRPDLTCAFWSSTTITSLRVQSPHPTNSDLAPPALAEEGEESAPVEDVVPMLWETSSPTVVQFPSPAWGIAVPLSLGTPPTCSAIA
ncbi:hypothetical protein K438DRAFT_1979041 [Mycena galopus ATCC 62051]|nr:hypothetical protein K438DRAFT_1979041 [Mycena galopus ATCC 62051]